MFVKKNVVLSGQRTGIVELSGDITKISGNMTQVSGDMTYNVIFISILFHKRKKIQEYSDI